MIFATTVDTALRFASWRFFIQPNDNLKQMRITVSHTKSKAEVIRSVDQSFDDLFRGIGVIPIQFVDERRSWQGSTLTFSFSAKMGFVSTPMSGTIEVTDRDITIDADLGLLERLIPTAKARSAITNRVTRLLT
jgi:hypothetical protein